MDLDFGTEDGGAEENTTGTDSGQDSGDDNADGPVTFESKADLVKYVNGIVKTRVARESRKYAPVVQERDTLKSELEKLRAQSPESKDSTTQPDPRVDELQKQLNELLEYRKTTERNELVRRVAKDKGLPEEFIPHVNIVGDDEDDIASSIEDFVSLLPKNEQKQQNLKTKPDTKDEGKGDKGRGGNTKPDDNNDIDPKALAQKIGRYGQNLPFVVSN
ncbi:scaffolding protein [Mycobacterium phage Azrael100]|uniref:Scaffolding protein n=1 Tax=Mycobacterium phage Cosmo TaxID=1567467 RepID=A0A0B5A4U1_9CAUD|nr:scaffolding protein [Mycobacterium phage Cosmo]WKR36039.1 scaffolding protein [Mycobacterium phage Azrael100]